jgi:hypothetical protein
MTGDPAAASIDAGSLCLEFAAAMSGATEPPGAAGTGGAGDGEPTEGLQRLAGWLRFHGLPEPVGGLTGEDLQEGRALSASISAIARTLLAPAPPDPEHVRRLNSFGRHPTPVFFLRASGRERVVLEEVDVAAAFAVIARDAIALFATPDISRLRQCAGPGCGLLFVDRSPSGRRRWCSMKRCGERAASALYRRRRAMMGSPRAAERSRDHGNH